MVVRVATTSTTNITGLRIINRGSSFWNAWPTAGSRIDVSSMLDFALREWVLVSILGALVGCAGEHREVLDDRPKSEGG